MMKMLSRTLIRNVEELAEGQGQVLHLVWKILTLFRYLLNK